MVLVGQMMGEGALFNLADCSPSSLGTLHCGCPCCLLCQLCPVLAFAGSEHSLAVLPGFCLALASIIGGLSTILLIGTATLLLEGPKSRFAVGKPAGDCCLCFRQHLFSSFADCIRDIIQSDGGALGSMFCGFKKPLLEAGGLNRISGWVRQPPVDTSWGLKFLSQFLPSCSQWFNEMHSRTAS